MTKQYDIPKEYSNYYVLSKMLKPAQKSSAATTSFAPFSARLPLDMISRLISIRQIGYLTSAGGAAIAFSVYESALAAVATLKQAKVKLDTAQNKDMAGKFGIFVLTGIPGANKTDLATSFVKSAVGTGANNWAIINTAPQQTNHPEEYNLSPVKAQLLEQIKGHPTARNILLVLRGYHAALPYLRLLLEDKELASSCILRAVVTKVNAMNFFRNRHHDVYPCLAENCSKGVSSAIVVERGVATENRVEKILGILAALNAQDRIVTLRAPRLTQTAFEDLSSLLVQTVPYSTGETMNLGDIYRRYGYTFGTMQASHYFAPRVVARTVLNCGIPVQEMMLKVNLAKVLGEPVKDWKVALGIKEEETPKTMEKKKLYVDNSEERKLTGRIP